MKEMKGEPVRRTLNVWVQPLASQNEIVGYRNGYLRIRVKAKPTDGKANRLCREVLATALGIAPSRIEIISGASARYKRMRVNEVESTCWRECLKKWEGLR
jgi:hypothetical protein